MMANAYAQGAGMAIEGGALTYDLVNALSKQAFTLPEYDAYTAKQAEADTSANALANFADAAKLVSKVNRFNTQEIADMLAQSSPQAQALINKQAEITMSQLRGERSQDEMNALQNSSAAKALEGGYSGSQFGYVAQLNRDSKSIENKINQGFNHANEWLQGAMSRLGNPMKVQDMFLGPQATWQIGDTVNKDEFNYNYMKDQLAYTQKEAKNSAWANYMHAVGGMLMGSGGMGGMMGGGQTQTPSTTSGGGGWDGRVTGHTGAGGNPNNKANGGSWVTW